MLITDTTAQLSHYEYLQLRTKRETYNTQRKLYFGDKSITELEKRMLPPQPTSMELSAIEVFEFENNTSPNGTKHFVYVNDQDKITTFAGHVLGDIIYFGKEYKCYGFGGNSVRQYIKVYGINKLVYGGNYCKSSGNYARIKIIK